MRSTSEQWLGRFARARTLHETAAFQVRAARDLSVDREVLVVAPESASPAAATALAKLFAAHREPPHPAIAPALELDTSGELPFVVFDAPARCDLDGLLRSAIEQGHKATHAEADGFIVTLRDALIASAKRRDANGRPLCLGTISFANVYFGSDGGFWLVGLGHNVAVHDAHGRLNARSRFFQAPEVAVGDPATPSSDFVALLQLTRAAMAFVDLDLSIARCVAGNSLGEDVELVRRILWIERNVVHASRAHRATIEQTIRVSDRIRELIGVWPDADAFRARVARILGREPEVVAPTPLLLAKDASWFMRAGHARVDLSGRKVLARLLLELARERRSRPGRAVPAQRLIEAAWPGERAHPRSAANRLYVSINTLRKLGLGGALVRGSGGYRLSEDAPLEWPAVVRA